MVLILLIHGHGRRSVKHKTRLVYRLPLSLRTLHFFQLLLVHLLLHFILSSLPIGLFLVNIRRDILDQRGKIPLFFTLNLLILTSHLSELFLRLVQVRLKHFNRLFIVCRKPERRTHQGSLIDLLLRWLSLESELLIVRGVRGSGLTCCVTGARSWLKGL